MEEMLKIVYLSFLNSETPDTSECIRIINKNWETTEEALNELEDIVSRKIFDELYDKITSGASDIQEAAFIAGFSCCAKFMSNGKVDLFAMQDSNRGDNV